MASADAGASSGSEDLKEEPPEGWNDYFTPAVELSRNNLDAVFGPPMNLDDFFGPENREMVSQARQLAREEMGTPEFQQSSVLYVCLAPGQDLNSIGWKGPPPRILQYPDPSSQEFVDRYHKQSCYRSLGPRPPGPFDPDQWWTPAPISQEDLDRYRKQVDSSGGYDVDYIPDMEHHFLITPRRDDTDLNVWARRAEFAINHYNQDKEEARKLELVKLLKVNVQMGGYTRLYMTFEARDKDGHAKIYQAKTENRRPDPVVLEFRLKPGQQT